MLVEQCRGGPLGLGLDSGTDLQEDALCRGQPGPEKSSGPSLAPWAGLGHLVRGLLPIWGTTQRGSGIVETFG